MIEHKVSKTVRGEYCITCRDVAAHKVRPSAVKKGQTVPHAFLCCKHFQQLFGNDACETEVYPPVEPLNDGKWCLGLWHVWSEPRRDSWAMYRECRRCGKTKDD